MSDSTLKVRGYAVVAGEPDEAEVSITLTKLDAEADTALAEVARRSEELEKLLQEMEIERSARSTSGISVREEREYDKGKYHHRGYRATNVLRVRLQEAQKVGRLVQHATSRALAQVDGPWWRIALDNPARVEACRQAAAEAKRKAEAYATALGARLGVVMAVAEPGLEGERYGDRVYAMADMAPASPRSPELTVEAGELDISAAVDVTFRLEQG